VIQVFRLTAKGRYVTRSESTCLPGFPFGEATRLLSQRSAMDETTLARTFRKWVRKHQD
jgi:hypothetical protein